MKNGYIFLFLIFALLIFASILLFYGPVSISITEVFNALLFDRGEGSSIHNIIWKLRTPKIVTAILAGSSLAVCGLIMQTFFQNPLAGPFVLGTNSGSVLGVALWFMASELVFEIIPTSIQYFGTTFAAITGAFFILIFLLFISNYLSGKVILLVMGLMFGHFTNGIINILVVVSEAHKIKNFLLWSLGSFQRISGTELIIFSSITTLGLLLSIFFIKYLNILLIGDRYAYSSGLSLKKIKHFLILLTAVLSGTVTAFCGPIVFIGIIVPHLTRSLFNTSDHKIILPGVMLIGAILATVAECFASCSQGLNVPINAIFGLLGPPVIFIFLWNQKKTAHV